MVRSFIHQYKLYFLLLWGVSYIIYPSWALPVSEVNRYLIVAGLMLYFSISFNFLSRSCNSLNIKKPIFIRTNNLLYLIKNNLWLFFVCCIAVILHLNQIVTRPILLLGDEALHIQGGLWIYNYIDSSAHKYFQFAFWTLVVLGFFIIKKKNIKTFFTEKIFQYKSGNFLTNRLIVFIFCVMVIYFLFMQNWQYYPAIVRYPPLSRLLYFVLYSFLGINHLWPRLLQLVFYVFGAVYLYRTINLFSDERTSLIGSSIYLFFPVTFLYANLAELASGTIFFIILISFHFLRFIKDKEDRDIILTSFFIGAGFLYKRPIFLMVFICAAYLIFKGFKSKNLFFLTPLKVTLLALIPIVPWMIIGKFFTWRNYKPLLSNLIPPHGNVFTYLFQIPSSISWILFVMFIFAIIFILIYKRSDLSMFFFLIFSGYYIFFAVDSAMEYLSPRLSMVLYPTIAVFIALFISTIVNKVRWKYAFKFIYVILLSYLIAICVVPPLNAKYIHSSEFNKLQDYPSEKAMKWVQSNVVNEEKILTLRIMSALFYRDKYKIDKNKIVDFWYMIREVSTPEKLRKFIVENKVTHIMFPYGPEYPYSESVPLLQYLKENQENEFTEAAKFNIGENYIYIYTIPVDNSVNVRSDRT